MLELALDLTDLEEDRRPVGADDHREPVAEVPDADGVAVGVKDVDLVKSVLSADGAMIGSSTSTR